MKLFSRRKQNGMDQIQNVINLKFKFLITFYRLFIAYSLFARTYYSVLVRFQGYRLNGIWSIFIHSRKLRV